MRKERRWKLVALLAVGMSIGIVMTATPVGAHVAGWGHNWNKHIKPKVNKLVGRAAVSQTSGVAVTPGFSTITDVDVKVPKQGFVLVTGTARVDSGTTCPCEAGMILSDGSSSSFVYRLHRDATGDSTTASVSFVFPATKGTHTYSVQLDTRTGNLAGATSDATITALYVPYNGAGKSVSARPVTARAQPGG